MGCTIVTKWAEQEKKNNHLHIHSPRLIPACQSEGSRWQLVVLASWKGKRDALVYTSINTGCFLSIYRLRDSNGCAPFERWTFILLWRSGSRAVGSTPGFFVSISPDHPLSSRLPKSREYFLLTLFRKLNAHVYILHPLVRGAYTVTRQTSTRSRQVVASGPRSWENRLHVVTRSSQRFTLLTISATCPL